MKARIIMIIMAVALIALPAMAQQEQWQSTSTMQGTGSTLAPQVTAVGATAVPSEATTTANYAPGRPGTIKRSKDDPGEVDTSIDKENSPVGDAIIPLILMSVVFCGVIALRRKRNALNH